MKHASHPEILTRLKRAEGHLRSIIAMIGEERSCLDIAQQLHAVEAAVANAKKQLIHDHIEHCLDDAVSEGTLDGVGALKELKTLAKYL
jgi:DNA-binding FrmR family transcriptional regulator